jgi:hypothetical protein
MSNRVLPLLACGAWLMATAAHAQSAPAAAPVIIAPAQSILAPAKDVPTNVPVVGVDPLTVRAAPDVQTAKKESQDFVKSYAGVSPAIDQIARWHNPVCISVAGLSDAQTARVSGRILEVAEGLGMHAQAPGCKPNIEVVFTDQPQAFMDKVATTREEVLGYYHRREKESLKAVTRPIQAWYVTATVSGAVDTASLAFATLTTSVGTANGTGGGADGSPISIGNTLSTQAKPEVADDPDNTVPSGCADAPQFTHCLASHLRNVLIVVDTTHLKPGQTLGPVSDYLSMLAMAQTKSLDGCAALPSVIDMMGKPCIGRDAPNSITPADAAYLTALYTSNAESNKALEVDEIATNMGNMLTRRNGGR